MAREDGAPVVLSEWDRLSIGERPFGSRISVHVRPRSSRSAILGPRDGVLEVALQSPPADGAANAELFGLLARALSVRKADLTIAVGPSARNKVIDVNGVRPADARDRLKNACK